MAWETPKTWASEPLTSIDLNEQVRDNLNHLKDRFDGTSAAAQYISTSDYSTSGTAWVDVDSTNMALTITTTGGDVLVTANGNVSNNNDSRTAYIGVDVDSGADFAQLYEQKEGVDGIHSFGSSWIFTGLSAGSHTFKLQWKLSYSRTRKMYTGALFDVREVVGRVA